MDLQVKIMVVDDEVDLEPLIRQKFRKQIRSNEYDFIFAHNGLEALAKLIEHPDIGVILSDINMPEMDGLTLLLKLKELKNPSLKTVVVSAYGDMENIRTAMNRGAFDFLTKPINFDDLEITINKTLDEIKIQRNFIYEHDQLISIQRDLNVAREIQQGILPQVFPPFPNRTEFDIYASMAAAREVGGDFFDFFMIDNDHLGFVIGDVSGKGIPAAIFMAVSRTLIRATGLKGMPPDECLQYVNKLLCNESVGCMFVTVFYAIINLKTGQIDYVNAGHNPPYILKENGEVVTVEPSGDMILGVFEDHEYRAMQVQLTPQQGILLFTDGVTEAFNALDEAYGEARLETVLSAAAGLPAQTVVGTLNEDVARFAMGTQQSDDITMLYLKYIG
ncbi:MAG TPA: fused response regulator/phosphatase [Bacteroidales bacterium]|nr:MAG: fused response regulator/phosphatase [Bacteroidetes bacterium GWE2_42_24]OFY26708.1 MAG: fused response regulator/phosphatase [Bacteroidetes bacterium GWF2_43_11]HBZ67967.1 fused response regulator/phosphatase [Bacteroidales bacterium]